MALLWLAKSSTTCSLTSARDRFSTVALSRSSVRPKIVTSLNSGKPACSRTAPRVGPSCTPAVVCTDFRGKLCKSAELKEATLLAFWKTSMTNSALAGAGEGVAEGVGAGVGVVVAVSFPPHPASTETITRSDSSDIRPRILIIALFLTRSSFLLMDIQRAHLALVLLIDILLAKCSGPNP